jgi:hypothetical protein
MSSLCFQKINIITKSFQISYFRCINTKTQKLDSSTVASSSTHKVFNVLFATGPTHFDSAYVYTKEILNRYAPRNIQVTRCDTAELIHNIQDTVVLIPFMSPITKTIIQHAPQLKLIIQFGVGLEGI